MYGKEALELRKVCNRKLDKRKETMNNTQVKVEDIFGDIISKDTLSAEKVTKLNKFSAKMM